MKTLPEWLDHLERLHPKGQGGIELGLDRVACVKAALQQKASGPVIVVGGTNGKGSTCAYLEAIYAAAGYRVGCYTSPHLVDYNERVRVDRGPIDDDALCEAFSRVEAARQAAGNVALTYFEFGTLAAWEVFARRGVDVTILEVGLGGRLDAVNVYDADCAIVTGIAIDHTDWLGPTRETIGFEKAGIFRPAAGGRVAICADPEPPQSLLSHAARIGADLRLFGRDFGFSSEREGWTFLVTGAVRLENLPCPALIGDYQLRNATAALMAIDVLGGQLVVTPENVRRGLLEPDLKGRFQRLPGRPTIVLDVAHNPQATGAFAANLEAMEGFAQTIAVVGMLRDKDMAGALAPLAGRVDRWLVAGLDVPRGAPAEALVSVIETNRLGGLVERFDSPAAAFAHAGRVASENDRIIVFGSFYTVAAVLRAVQNRG